MGDLAYYDGVISDYSEARISLSDRSVFFGDGVYDVMLCRGGKCYQSEEHLRRLSGNAEAIGLTPSITAEELCSLTEELCFRSGYYECVVYAQLARRADRRVHGTGGSLSPALLITVTEYGGYVERPLRLISLADLRHRMCHVKTLNLLPAVLAVQSAEACGCDEAVLLRDGIVTEGARSNVSILKDNCLYTHPTDNLILPGIMRANLLRACRGVGIPVRECEFGYGELIGADEVLVTSTTKFIRRVSEIDGTRVKMADEEAFSALKEALLCDYLSHNC